nr:E3 ubiquitin-protein ligase RNF4-like [Megalopta genalis]
MSHPIDYIDLTIDSPVNNALRTRNINIDDKSGKRRIRKSQRNHIMRQDSVIQVPVDNPPNNTQSEEIIDLDKIKSTDENIGIRNNSKCEERKVLAALSCPICYEDLSSDNRPMSTPCGHIFCQNCLTQAIQISKRCPICKKLVKLQRCTRLHF